MQRQVSRRTLTKAAPASLLTFGNPTTSFARTPKASPEDERYPDLLDKLANTDPKTTLDLLLETPFEAGWLVPLASNPPFQPEAVDPSEDDDQAFGTEMLGIVSLVNPDRDVDIGVFLVFPDEALAADVVDRVLAGIPKESVQRLPLAGLDAAMTLSGERRANVVVRAHHVVMVSSDQILADGALTNSFAAQIRALQHALGLIWHLYQTI